LGLLQKFNRRLIHTGLQPGDAWHRERAEPFLTVCSSSDPQEKFLSRNKWGDLLPGKPLKRLFAILAGALVTGLKPGVNEKGLMNV
jgi:hypothetical protein